MQHLLCAILLALNPQVQSPPSAIAQATTQTPIQVDLAPFESLAAQLQAGFESDKPINMAPCFDLDSLFEKATANVQVEREFLRGFCDGARSSLLPAFVDSVRTALGEGGSLRLLRIRTRGSEQRLLFRFLLPDDGGVNYIEFASLADRAGHARVRDWYDYSTGEWVSDSIRRLFLPFAAQSQRGLFDRLLGNDQLMVRHWDEIVQLIECVKQGKLARGLQIFEALPQELRRNKYVLLQRLRLTQASPDESAYAKALEDLRRFHPDDPANDLHSVDFYYMRQDWKQSAAAVRRLREGIEGDPFLDYLEGSLQLQAEDFAGARKSVERSIAAEPEFLQAHWILVSINLAQKDHAGVLAALKVIDAGFELEWEDLSQTEGYENFAASREFEAWTKYLQEKR